MNNFYTKHPKIAPLFQVRNDGNNMIIYNMSANSSFIKVLSPIEALILLLCNGNNSIEEIQTIILRSFDTGYKDKRHFIQLLDALLNKLINEEKLLIITKPSKKKSESSFYVNKNSVPDFSNYQYPVTRLLRPLSVVISYTNKCNCSCCYCYAERKQCEERTLEQWRGIFDELQSLEIKKVDIGGGDILARTDAYQILEELTKRGFLFFLSTKSYISQENAQKLFQMHIGTKDASKVPQRPLQISLDSIDEKISTTLIHSNHHVQESIETVKNLISSGIEPRIKGVLTSYNYDAAEDVVKYFYPLGVREFYFAQYSRSYYRHDDNLFLSHEQKLFIKNTENQIKTTFPDVFLSIQTDTSDDGFHKSSWSEWKNRTVHCSGGRSKLWIHPNGDVTLCEQIPHSESYVMGNVFTDSIMSIWNSQKLLDFIYPGREKFSGTVCYTCEEFDSCHEKKGVCFRNSLYAYGTIYNAQPECPLQLKYPPRRT
jgi:MoaA/NifB/PqqE/SkfB family radical SAM enzyme